MIDSPLRAASQPDQATCGVCRLHNDQDAISHFEIHREPLWLLRHHPLPAPLPGWLMLDARRHLGGPIDFNPEEAAGFGPVLQRGCALVRELTGCDRVYAIAFGEGARHLHLHLIPRFGGEPATEAWRVADLYRAMESGARPPADLEEVAVLVRRARERTALWR